MRYAPDSFTVIVTYGNAWPHQRWASEIKTHRDARILRETAVGKGFADAEIWREKDFQAFLQEKERERAAAFGDDRRRQ